MNEIEVDALDLVIDYCDNEPLRETARKGLAELRKNTVDGLVLVRDGGQTRWIDPKALAELEARDALFPELVKALEWALNEADTWRQSRYYTWHHKRDEYKKTLTEARELTDGKEAERE